MNVRGELFSATLSFVVGAAARLASSLILTRLLYPEAYGIIAIIASTLFVIEMLSDVGVVGLVIRHERGDEPAFLHTLWTIRLARGVVNCAILFMAAPWLALLIGDGNLQDPLRVVALYFLLNGLSSMSYALAMRHQRSRVVGYVELGCSLITTVFVIVYSLYSRDHWGMIYGMLGERALNTLASYAMYRHRWPRFALDRQAVGAALNFSKYVMPTSMLTMALAQYDKLVFVRLFDLRTLGIFGVGASVAGPAEALTLRVCEFVLYPRCAAINRDAPSTLRTRFYSDNLKLLLLITAMPPLLGGAGQAIIALMYDPRYTEAGFVLQALMIRAALMTFVRPAESLLTAVGELRAQLIANAIRLVWLVPASLLGYWLYGFKGFVLLAALDALPAAGYLLYVQFKRGLLIVRYELWRIAFILLCWASSAVASHFIMMAWRAFRDGS